jgi:hypothetical protein
MQPFKVKPFIVWVAIIVILILVILASARSNYQARGSMKEVVYDKPTTVNAEPPMAQLAPSPTVTPLTQIPDDTYTPITYVPPNLFPEPADKMKEYDHVNLTLQPLDSIGQKAVRMISLDEADESMYPATLDEIFKASEGSGFMQASVDTLYDVMALKPPRLMTDEVN